MQKSLQTVLERVEEKFGKDITGQATFRNQLTLYISKENWHEVNAFLKTDPACSFDFCVDLAIVQRPAGYEITCFLFSSRLNQRLRIKTSTDGPITSLADLWPRITACELECGRKLPGLRFVAADLPVAA